MESGLVILLATSCFSIGIVLTLVIKGIIDNKLKRNAELEASRIEQRAASEAAKIEREAKIRAKDFEKRLRRNAEDGRKRNRYHLHRHYLCW